MNLPPKASDANENAILEGTRSAPMLALETSGKSASVALRWSDGHVDSLETRPSVGSAQTLAPAIAEILNRHSLSSADLKAIAVTVGPGSFTGLRVGVATAKAMAYALKIPAVAVDSLETIAWAAALSFQSIRPTRPGDVPMKIWTIMDAYRGELFAALWQIRHPDSALVCIPLVPSQLVSTSDWTQAILGGQPSPAIDGYGTDASIDETPLIVAGPGLIRCRHLLQTSPMAEPIVEVDLVPHASAVASIAYRKLQRNETVDAFHLMPVYLRGSAAEEKRKSKASVASGGSSLRDDGLD